MNRRKDFLIGAFAALGMALLILDGKTALAGAREGVWLCVYTLIPTLLPFFFLSNLLTGSLMGRRISLLRPLGRLCRIPDGAEYILLIGLLGGYPLGAQAINTACKHGTLSLSDGRRMLAFCNNCGPAFLFGISAALFQDPILPWLLFAIHILSAFIVGMMIPGSPARFVVASPIKPTAIQSLRQAISSLAGVCGWVVLFRIIIHMLDRWFLWYFSEEIQVCIMGLLELSNGCISLSGIDSSGLRFILCAGFLAFGGVCVTMQTYSAAPNIDKSLYFPGKVMQAAISLTLSGMFWNPKCAMVAGVLAIGMGIFLRMWENRCRNSKKLVV